MRAAALSLLSAILLLPSVAAASTDSDTAALQVRLRALELYAGPVSGVVDSETTAAIRALQQRVGLPVDGVVGPRTRVALGVWARWPLGTRELRPGHIGWDVAALQFRLAWRGFPSGRFSGVFDSRLEAALRRFQIWSALPVTGRADRTTVAAVQQPPLTLPMTFVSPLAGSVTDGFAPRGDRFHTGLDIPAPSGTPVAAAADGRVVYAAPLAGGWGVTVTIAHGNGVRTMYAHLSEVSVGLGQRVKAGQRVGLVGATGDATGPHLHFEARLRGAAVDLSPAIRPA